MDYPTFATKYKLRLNARQQEAVQAVQGPVLLLAVPGSGKTTTLIARLGYLVYGFGIPPESILTTTYTVAATGELRSRFGAQFGPEMAGRLAFRTLNGICAQVISAYERAGHTAFTLVTEEGRLNALLSELWQAIQQDYPTESDLRGLRTQITYIKNQMLTEQELAGLETEGGSGKIQLGALYRAYTQALQKRRWMDYDDQMVYALAILRRQPGILRQFRDRYRYFCVDEAQDTSRIQHAILALLAGETKNLFMVGDEDQSIYGFRAACPEALLDFEVNWPGASVLLMEENYRSTPQIVAAAGAFIRQNQARREKQMHTPNPDGPAVKKLLCADRQEQYRRLADLAETANRTGTETAVLYRDNDTALPIIDLLARRGIPYRARKVDGLFFSCRMVRDITDILHLAENPADGEAFLRVYYKLGAGISRLQAEAAASGRGAVLAALRRMELSAWARERVQALQTNFRCLAEDSATTAIHRIVERMGYGAYLEEHQTDRGRLNILQALAAGEPTPAALLARLETLQALVRAGTEDSNSPFVLSTIHSSKGLEYDHVVLADAVNGVLPQDTLQGQLPTEEELAALEEDRRLFYVGMTRARRSLTVVTFSHPCLGSAFGDALFPPPRPVAGRDPYRDGIGSPAKRPAVLPTATLPTGRRPPTGARLEALCRDYYPGVRVVHSKYGAGTVQARNADTITIDFGPGGPHTFLLTAALAARALRLEGI